MAYRMALRRTQKDVDAAKSEVGYRLEDADRKTLQQLAKAAGIPANQSTDKLREALNR